MNNLENIAHKIRNGDEQAFEQVFRRYYAGMCGYAQKYLSDLDQAEEIVQEVFYNFWLKRSRLEVKGILEAYLYRAVRNACLNHIKHLSIRKQYVLDQIQPLKEEENKNHDKVIALELQQKIEASIGQLPPERQKIFKLSRYEGLKYKEIALRLNISLKTVETQMGKALQFMRENLSEYLPLLLVLVSFYS